MRFRGAVKTTVMYLLIVSIVLMSAQLWLLGNLSLQGADAGSALRLVLSTLGFGDLTSAALGGGSNSLQSGLFEPSSITVATSAGARSTLFSASATAAVYGELKEYLLSQFESSAVKTDVGEWDGALGGEDGILYDFGREFNLKLYASLENVGLEKTEITARYIYQTRTCLLVKDALDEVYRFETSSNIDMLIAMAEQAAPLGRCVLVGRMERENLVSESVFNSIRLRSEGVFYAPGGTKPKTFFITNAMLNEQGGLNTSLLQNVLSAFGYNIGTVKRYTEPDGTEVFVENYSDLKVSRDGALSFRAFKAENGISLSSVIGAAAGEYYTATEVVSAAAAMMNRFDRYLTGGQVVAPRFESAYYDKEDDTFNVVYSYCADGLQIADYERAFIFKYNGGYFVEAQCVFRNCVDTGNALAPIDIRKQAELYELTDNMQPEIITMKYEQGEDGVFKVGYFEEIVLGDQESEAAG